MNFVRLPLLVTALTALLLAGCDAPPETAQTPNPETPAASAANTPSSTAEGTAAEPAGDSAETGAAPTGGKGPVRVVMETSKGTIELELDPGKAPITVANFVKYAEKGHYDGTIFHRVISTFMIQGGGFDTALREKKAGPEIKNESDNGLRNERGTIAMARRGDPDSASAQFFINVENNDSLDYPNAAGSGYTVFGKVTRGMDVVDAIRAVPTGNREATALDQDGKPVKTEFQDVPLENVVIKSVKVKK